MITYVDTSVLIKLMIAEPGSEAAAQVWSTSDDLASACLIGVEARCALAAATRARRLTARQHREAKIELAQLLDELAIVAITGDLVEAAATLAEDQALRAYDAVHLAAAVLVGADVMSTSDAHLGAAATRIGLHVADPTA